MKIVLCGFFVSAVALAAVLLTVNSVAQAAAGTKKAIVITSFGTSFDDSRTKNIGSLEAKVKKFFPDYTVCQAFTSKIILKKLQERGIAVNSLESTLDNLKREGYSTVILQSAHLTPGEEYTNKVLAVAEQYKDDFQTLTVGRPIMMFKGDLNQDLEPDDFAILREAIKQQIPPLQAGQEVVFMGHGSPHRHNPAYEILQEEFDAAALPVTIGVVEASDYPNLSDVMARLQAKETVESVILMPLLLTAGDHAHRDMLGDDLDSWKSTLESAGYVVTAYLHGLGENEAFQAIYLQHIQDAIDGKYSVLVK